MIRLGQFLEHGENKKEIRKEKQYRFSYDMFFKGSALRVPPNPLEGCLCSTARHKFVNINIGCHTRKALPLEDNGLKIETNYFS